MAVHGSDSIDSIVEATMPDGESLRAEKGANLSR
jgi:hypothetical protein